MKQVSKSLIQDWCRYEERIELKTLTMLGEQVQNVNLIFNFLVLLGFLTPADKVSIWPTDEIRPPLNEVE